MADLRASRIGGFPRLNIHIKEILSIKEICDTFEHTLKSRREPCTQAFNLRVI